MADAERDYFASGVSHRAADGTIRTGRLPANGAQTIGTAPVDGEESYRFRVWRGATLLFDVTQRAAEWATAPHRGAVLTLSPNLPAFSADGALLSYHWEIAIDGAAWEGPFPLRVNQPPSAPYDLTAAKE